jgi:hypothetical protein
MTNRVIIGAMLHGFSLAHYKLWNQQISTARFFDLGAHLLFSFSIADSEANFEDSCILGIPLTLVYQLV